MPPGIPTPIKNDCGAADTSRVRSLRLGGQSSVPPTRSRYPWVQLALSLCLAAAAVGISLVLFNLSRSGSEIREESAEVLSLTKMAAQLEAMDLALAQLMGVGGRESGLRPELLSDDVIGPLSEFDRAFAELQSLSRDPAMLAIQAARDDYLAAVDDLQRADPSGADLFTQFHGPVEAAEAALRAALLEVQLDEVAHLQDAINGSAAADAWLRGLVPALAALALLVAASLLLVWRQRRKHELTSLVRDNQQKDVFIASVSHELRTPLTSVIGFLTLLEQDWEIIGEAERRDLVAIARQEAADLVYLVEDLLVLAKDDAGGLIVVSDEVSLRAESVYVLETMSESNNIEIVGAAPCADGDPARIRQILRNLLTNARRYGGPNVRIELDTDGREAIVRVADDGPGVAEADERRIFEPYQRAHDAPGVSASVGLGLAVSRRLAELMGGRLEYRRTGGRTVFELALPRARDRHEPMRIPAPVIA